MNRSKDIKGMTLLEVAIALFTLAIGLLGLAGLQLVALRGDTLGHQATLATTLAKTKMAELQKAEQLTDGADQYIDKANGMTYDRQWSVNHDVPQPEMAIVRVRVSWRGELADRAVMVSAKAALAKSEVALTKGSPPVWFESPPET
ncbi:MAG: prepilin-type N-terminal cleavage/methylation domain-containing protein [Desulfobacterales bacterium]|nr:prepilin-type N-terminal cleavage/methylation domain-containing protein [Desulfobacterales bacterium]